VRWYVSGFIVAPNQLVRERPFIAHNVEMTRRAYALDRIETHAFPPTLESRRWNRPRTRRRSRTYGYGLAGVAGYARQIQEIRLTTTFQVSTSIDIRSWFGPQMMLATRELNVEKLPQSSRNWINEKLIYTTVRRHDEPSERLTPEGLPTLVLSNMPIQSTIPGLTVTRPEIISANSPIRRLRQDSPEGIQTTRKVMPTI